MNNPKNSINAATSWSQIDQFRIRHVHQAEPDGSVKLFSNNNQQLTFEIDIRALDANGREVILNNEALSRIRLIDYYTGEEIPFENYFSVGWNTTFSHFGYEWSHDIFSYIGTSTNDLSEENVCKFSNEDITYQKLIARGVKPQNLQASLKQGETLNIDPPELNMSPVTNIYLDCRGVSEKKKIAVKITSPDGHITVVSNNSEAPEGNPSGDGNGKFNSFVTVTPVQLRNLDISCYGELVERSGEWILNDRKVYESDNWVTYESQLWCKPGGGLNIDFTYAVKDDTFPDFSLYNENGEVNGTEAIVTYYADPGNATLNEKWPAYFVARSGNTHFPTQEFRNFYNKVTRAEAGKVVIGAHYIPLNGWFIEYRGGPVVRNLEQKLILWDKYGNMHRVGIRFDATGLKHIVPFKW